jgi:hypothetical protein
VSQPPFELAVAHRWFAIECNNDAWSLLEAAALSAAESERMIHQAHAACHHWLQVGTVLHHARAQNLLANAYAAAGRAEPALHHARRTQELLKEAADAAADWDWAFAHDALARAHAVAGDVSAAAFRAEARAAGDRIADPEDKAAFDQWFVRELPGSR